MVYGLFFYGLSTMVYGLPFVEAAVSEAHESGEERFFSGCANRSRLMLYREGEAPRAHMLLYTVGDLMELEVIRLADWTLDLPIPGPQLRPLEQGVKGLRYLYHRVDASRPVQRVGQLVDALQIPELSFGDLALIYGVATSGMLVRVNKLIDWTQDVTGDLNSVVGWPVGRRDGLMRWRAPAQVVDGAQMVIASAVHHVSILAAWLLEKSLAAAEGGVEGVLNIGTPTPHRLTTVCARLPVEVYREYAPWFLAHRRALYIGSADTLATLTHAQLFHPGVWKPRFQWWMRSPSGPSGSPRDPSRGIPSVARGEASSVILVTNAHTMARAPAALRPYVIPAAWVFEPLTPSPR